MPHGARTQPLIIPIAGRVAFFPSPLVQPWEVRLETPRPNAADRGYNRKHRAGAAGHGTGQKLVPSADGTSLPYLIRSRHLTRSDLGLPSESAARPDPQVRPEGPSVPSPRRLAGAHERPARQGFVSVYSARSTASRYESASADSVTHQHSRVPARTRPAAAEVRVGR